MGKVPWFHQFVILGRVSPKSSFTVVNANDTFIKYQPEADEFIKKELVRRVVNVIMNTKLNEIKKVLDFLLFRMDKRQYSRI